jgi:hypothetical protein
VKARSKHRTRDWAARGTLGAALAVACAAGATTAHGLYEVAVAAQIPPRIAWLYPVITDGLALVAYAATLRLSKAGRGYAWMVVVLAAGLSGVAQASYLAVGVTGVPPQLKFGIGAWPAIAAAIVAHLLFLLGTRHGAAPVDEERPVDAEPVRLGRPVDEPVVQPATSDAVQPAGLDVVQPSPLYKPQGSTVDEPVVRPAARPGVQLERATGSYGGGPAKERAYEVAVAHAAEHGGLPTVSELMVMAEVSRGTAGTALKELRQQRPNLHVVINDTTKATS